MISKPDLQKLINHRFADAKALYQKKRFHAAVYMSGYAVELALKNKICDLYNFTQGFSENKNEFQSYVRLTSGSSSQTLTIENFRDIKIHDLNKLLFYSGKEYNVKNAFIREWKSIDNWNPEMRYKIVDTNKATAQKVLSSITTIINAVVN